MSDKQVEPLLHALIPIKDYLPDANIVISGGWVPFIYQHYVLPCKGQRNRTVNGTVHSG